MRGNRIEALPQPQQLLLHDLRKFRVENRRNLSDNGCDEIPGMVGESGGRGQANRLSVEDGPFKTYRYLRELGRCRSKHGVDVVLDAFVGTCNTSGDAGGIVLNAFYGAGYAVLYATLDAG